MKKTYKLVFPTLIGVMLLSFAATITGTISWFSANRAITFTTGEFVVVKTDGVLGVELTALAGTHKEDDKTINPKEVEIDEEMVKAKIGDVSFNPVTKELWDNNNGQDDSYAKKGNNTSYRAADGVANPYRVSDTVYRAFTWKIDLSYTWAASHTPVNVFFDATEINSVNHSRMVASSQSGGALQNETSKGFRIALIGTGHTVVFAGLETADKLKSVNTSTTSLYYGQDDTELDTISYSYFASNGFALGDTSAASITPYSSYSRAVDAETNQNQRADYLGQITYSGETDSTSVYCVAWYEGTDPNVVNEKEMEQVASTLKFYVAINS